MAYRNMNIIATAKKPSSSARLNVQTLEAREVPASGLGVASNYSAFYFENVNAYYSDIEGRVAVGGNASFTGYSVGTKLPNSNGTRDDLIVGHELTYTNGQVFAGNTVYGDKVTTDMFGHPQGDIHKGTPVNFAAARTELTNLSKSWAALKANGSVSNWYGNLTLKGTSATQNVFNLTAAQLWNAYGMTINAPAGSTVLVNVSGADVRMQFMGMKVTGTDNNHVVFNFNQANNLLMQGIGFEGSIVAPNAHFNFSNGAVRGTVVAKSMEGYGEIEAADPNIKINVPCCGSTLKGTVYYDKNNNGLIEAGENGLSQLTVTLTGTDVDGKRVLLSVKTDANGNYTFTNLKAGTYTVRTTAPSWMHAGKSKAGNFGGTANPNSICHIDLSGCGSVASGYNFGELCGCH